MLFSLELQRNIFLLEALRERKKKCNITSEASCNFWLQKLYHLSKPPKEKSSLLLIQKSLKVHKKTPTIHNRQKVYYSAINGAYQISRNNYQLKRLQSFSLLKFQLTCHPWNRFNSSSQQLIRAKTPKGQSSISLIPASEQVVRPGRKKRKTILHIPTLFIPTVLLLSR